MNNGSARRILVVDDTEANRYTVARYLKQEGFEVWEAATGKECLELARLFPDLIVLDVKLPDVMGYDLSRMLKNDPQTSSIPILQMSATYLTAGSRVQSLESGADAYLTWPFESDELLANVRALLRMRSAERDAVEAAERLQFILSTMMEAHFVLDEQRRVVQANRVALDSFFQVPEQELLGEAYRDVAPHAQDSEFHRQYERALSTNRSVHFEALCTPYNDWFEVYAYPRNGTLTVYLRNITDRKRAEEELRYQLNLVKSITDNTPLLLLLVDTEGRVTLANPASTGVTGYRPEELTGKIMHPVLHHTRPDGTPFPVEECRLHRAILEATPLKGHEDTFVHRDGRFYPVRCSVNPIIREGVPAGSVVEVQDITEEKKAREALAQAQAALKRHAEELEETVARRTEELVGANKELEAFSYSVAHDLRSPLRAVSGYAGVLAEEFDKQLATDGHRLVSLIKKSIHDMGALIDGLLNYSRLGRREMSRTTIDMTALAESVIAELRKTEPDRSIEVTVHPLPPAHGDPLLVRQALVNLVSNAVKFTRLQPSPRIEVGSAKNSPDGVYYVRDNGTGFDMRYNKQLFGVFRRLHGEEEFEGTGVGLAFTKRIVERHGGRIWAEGEVGMGATFYFSLPKSKGQTTS